MEGGGYLLKELETKHVEYVRHIYDRVNPNILLWAQMALRPANFLRYLMILGTLILPHIDQGELRISKYRQNPPNPKIVSDSFVSLFELAYEPLRTLERSGEVRNTLFLTEACD